MDTNSKVKQVLTKICYLKMDTNNKVRMSDQTNFLEQIHV